MKYQLVLQFQAESVQQFDELAVLEDLLVENLPSHSVGPFRGRTENTLIRVLGPNVRAHKQRLKRTQRWYRNHYHYCNSELGNSELGDGREVYLMLWPWAA
jgi:hypothetical protein